MGRDEKAIRLLAVMAAGIKSVAARSCNYNHCAITRALLKCVLQLAAATIIYLIHHPSVDTRVTSKSVIATPSAPIFYHRIIQTAINTSSRVQRCTRLGQKQKKSRLVFYICREEFRDM